MRFALMIEAQQGLSYAAQLALARRAEAAGFEAFFRSDHYASFPGPADGPTTDAWTILAGLARETERITLGVLVSPVTFRHPGNFVKVVTTVDEMSGGGGGGGGGGGWGDGGTHAPPPGAAPGKVRGGGRARRGGGPRAGLDHPLGDGRHAARGKRGRARPPAG